MTDDVKIAVLTNPLTQFMRPICRFSYMYKKLSTLIQRILFEFENKIYD